jgi:hypothetical protein
MQISGQAIPRFRYSVNEMKVNNRVRLARALLEIDAMKAHTWGARTQAAAPAPTTRNLSEVENLQKRIRVLFDRLS